MNRAPAHLEWKLRFYELSIGQIAAVVVAVIVAFVWARYVSPLHGLWGAASAVYVAALPAVPVVVASQSDLDLAGLVVGAVRWRRADARFLPREDVGECAHGYVVTPQAESEFGLGTAGAEGGVDLWLWTDEEEIS